MKEKIFIVASYDISDERRLAKISRIMKNYGERVLYSVFECLIDYDTFKKMKEEVWDVMDQTRDSVIYFRLCNKCNKKVKHFGRDPFFTEEEIVGIV